MGVLGLLAAVPAAGGVFRVSVVEGGVYRIGWEALAAAGLEGEVGSAGLGVSLRGVPVPVWVEDGGDGRFGAGDHIELAAERLAGERGWFHPFSDRNVYRLETAASSPARMYLPAAACEEGAGSFTARLHLERDELRARFSGGAEGAEAAAEAAAEEDVWFWARISHADAEPLSLRLELPGSTPARRGRSRSG